MVLQVQIASNKWVKVTQITEATYKCNCAKSYLLILVDKNRADIRLHPQ